MELKSISQTAKVLMESASQPASVMVTYKFAHLIYIWSATVGVLLASRRTRFLVSIPLPDTNFPGCFDTFDICLSVWSQSTILPDQLLFQLHCPVPPPSCSVWFKSGECHQSASTWSCDDWNPVADAFVCPESASASCHFLRLWNLSWTLLCPCRCSEIYHACSGGDMECQPGEPSSIINDLIFSTMYNVQCSFFDQVFS